MRRMLMGLLVVPAFVAVGLTLPVQARAIAVPVMPFPQVNKMQAAELVVTGQVVGIEDQDVKATVAPNSPATQTYRIAVIQITETLKGKATNNMIRVAFQPPAQPQPFPGAVPGGVAPGGAIQPLPAVQPGVAQPGVIIKPGVVAQPLPVVQPGQPAIQPLPAIQPVPQPFPIKKFPPFQPNFNVQLAVGMEGLFFLKQHHEGKFYTLVPASGNYVSTQNKDYFDLEVTQVKVTGNPMGALKAATPSERANAAIVLLKQYRQPIYGGKFGGPLQQVAISAEESKLILKGLLEAEWVTQPQPINYQKSPAQAFNMMGLQPQDGFQQFNGNIYTQEYANAARTWLEKNCQTYVIKKYVTAGVPGGPGIPDPAKQPVPGVIQPFPLPPAGAAPGGVGQAIPGVIQVVPVQVAAQVDVPVQAIPNKK